MSDKTMPERVTVGYGFYGKEWCEPESLRILRLDNATEYIRADVATAQLAERDARIAELEALVEVDAQSKEKYKTIIRQLEEKDGELHAIIGQRNRRIAELEAELADVLQVAISCEIDFDDEHFNARLLELRPPVTADTL